MIQHQCAPVPQYNAVQWARAKGFQKVLGSFLSHSTASKYCLGIHKDNYVIYPIWSKILYTTIVFCLPSVTSEQHKEDQWERPMGMYIFLKIALQYMFMKTILW